MAELQARYDNLETSAQSHWRHVLPDGQDVSIGRRPLTDLDVPDWNRSDWVVEDPRISGRHVSVNWDGSNLRVRRRLEPLDRPAINPVFFKGRAQDDFSISPGESFTIGSTTFTLQIRDAAVDEASEPDRLTRTIGREELRMSAFSDAKTPLMALADLPDLIRTTRDDAQLEDRVLDVILRGLPLAEFAGFAQIDPKAGKESRAAVTRSKQRGLVDDSFRVSNRLVRHATREVMESVLYIWDKKTDGSGRFSMTLTPGTDWAICTPLDERPNQFRSLYVAGRVPRNILNDEQLKRDPEFQDYQKFVNLVAELFSSMREMRRTEQQNSRLRQFLPRRMVALMEQQDLEERLKPRIADVTALFCDLRGSSLLASDTGDMMASWRLMSSALDIMTSAIHENDGVIGGLQGDAAVGFWGWPSSFTDQIERAVRAALSIRKVFARNRELNQAHFNCGIGLAHGSAVVGRLGTYDQFKLDAYGQVMNLSSRLESLTKHYGVEIMVDGVIAARLEKIDPEFSKWRMRSLGKVRPAGMSIRVPIFELMPPLMDANPVENSIPYNIWEAGVKAFMDGNWVKARERLERFRNALPDERAETEKAAGVLLHYMDKRHNKPPDGWDGTIEMDTK